MRNAWKGPLHNADNVQSRSLCTSVQSNLGISCPLTYSTVSTDSVSWQWRPRSACTNAQADQGLHCPHIAYGSFFCVHHISIEKCVLSQVLEVLSISQKLHSIACVGFIYLYYYIHINIKIWSPLDPRFGLFIGLGLNFKHLWSYLELFLLLCFHLTQPKYNINKG